MLGERQPVPSRARLTRVHARNHFSLSFPPSTAGYYLFFLSAPAVQSLEAQLGAKVAPRVRALASWPLSAAYDGLCRLGTAAALTYFVLPFIALGWDEGMRAWARLWYAGHVVAAGVGVALALLPAARRHHHHGHHGADGVRAKVA